VRERKGGMAGRKEKAGNVEGSVLGF